MALVDWWSQFQQAPQDARDAMLKPDEAPKKRRRSRSRKRRAIDGERPPPAADE
jgi:poly(A) polymerase